MSYELISGVGRKRTQWLQSNDDLPVCGTLYLPCVECVGVHVFVCTYMCG